MLPLNRTELKSCNRKQNMRLCKSRSMKYREYYGTVNEI